MADDFDDPTAPDPDSADATEGDGTEPTSGDTPAGSGPSRRRRPVGSARAAARARRLGDTAAARAAHAERSDPTPAPDADDPATTDDATTTDTDDPAAAPDEPADADANDPGPTTVVKPVRRGKVASTRTTAVTTAVRKPAAADAAPPADSDAATDSDADTDSDTDPRTDTATEVAARPPRRRTRVADKKRRDAEQTLAVLRWVPAVTFAVAALVLAVFCVIQGKGVWWDKTHVADERTQVLAAAKTCIAATTSYDYRKLKDSEAAGVACSTGTFASQYKQAMETVVAKLAPQSQTVQTFQIAHAGIESVSSDGKQWVVLLYGQQSVTNKTTGPTKPRLDILSARATMVKVGGTWKVSKLDRV